MRKFKRLCFPRRFQNSRIKHHLEFEENMENPQKSNSCSSTDVADEKRLENMGGTSSNLAENIILSHDFTQSLNSWCPNGCEALIVLPDSGYTEGTSESYALITNRKECWQGLEQDITSRVSLGTTYRVSACVGVSASRESSTVQATLKLEYNKSNTKYLFIEKIPVSKGKWEKLEGTFKLSSMPDRVVFYLEGPHPSEDLRIKSVVISCSSPTVLTL